ncbi:hypothetical protein D3C75_962660 [compost metagenome]
MSPGLMVTAADAFSTPLTNSFAVPPPSVTATCTHWFKGSWSVLTTCSAPPFLMANRRVLLPERGVRNIYWVVPAPKSKMRCHWLFASQYTQAATVISADSANTCPAGS